MTGPHILTKNYLNRHANDAGDLTASTGQTTAPRLYDMDPLSRWQSAGSNDATTETLEFGLWIPGARASHDVRTILVLNHNIKGLKIEVSNNNGSTWTTVYDQSAVDEANTKVLLIAPADRVKFTMTTTQTANEEKKVGCIIVSGAEFHPGELFEYKQEPYKVAHKTAKMADGSLRGQTIGRSAASSHFWAAKCGWIVDPADFEDRDAFEVRMALWRAYGLQGTPFVFVPEPESRPGFALLCRVRPGTYNDPYIKPSEHDGGMVAIQMVIEELGGA